MYDNRYKQDFTEEELKHEIWKDVSAKDMNSLPVCMR